MPYDVIIGRNESDKAKFGKAGLLNLGKTFVQMGTTSSLTNPILMDVARSHVVLIAGKRGCLIGETMIFTDKGYKPIKEFNEKKDKLLSFNKKKKTFEWEKARLLNYKIKDEKLFKIEFNDGRSIILTKEHPLLINYGKHILWRKARGLKINDKIILPTQIPEIKKDTESLRIARILGFIMSDGTMNRRKGRWKDGRGHWYNGTKSRLRLFNACPEVLETAKEDFEEEFNIIAKRYKRNNCNCGVIESKQSKVVDKLHDLGIPLGNKSARLRVPKVVWESSNKFKANFIAGLFSCDGYINKTGRYVDYSSKSKKFLEDLQILLSHFNIESTIKIKNAKLNGKIYENYRLFITDNHSMNKFKKIGFFSKFKNDRLEKRKDNGTRKKKTFYFTNELVCKKITKITEVEKVKEVFDLTVDKNHSFIANGIISHNSGKSYTLGVLAEEIASLPKEVSQNLSTLIFDTMGIFWTMAYANDKEPELLKSWGLKGKKLPINIFVPLGFAEKYKEMDIPVTKGFAFKVSELTADDWSITFGLQMMNPASIVTQKTIAALKEKKKEYDVDDIINLIKNDKEASHDAKSAAINLFEAAKTWGIFVKKGEEGTSISELVEAGETSVLDLSTYSSTATFNVRALVIGLITKKIFLERTLKRKNEEVQAVQHGLDYLRYKEKREMPLVWLMIDELHEFLPEKGKTAATDALIQLIREGRQPGISLVGATQQPGKVHTDIWTQSDIVLAHRLTAKPDVQALSTIMQSYLTDDIQAYMNQLPDLKGSAIILDDNSERIYPMRMRARFTWHGGESPTSIQVKKRI